MTVPIHIHRRLPDSQVYACSKRDTKAAVDGLEGAEVHFGMRAHFEFESRCSKRPELIGDVIASVTVDPQRATNLHLYPVAQSEFSQREMDLFVKTQLPAITTWARDLLALPETQLTGHRQLIVESVVDGFRRHEVSFL